MLLYGRKFRDLSIVPGLLPNTDAVFEPVCAGACDFVPDKVLRKNEELHAANLSERLDPLTPSVLNIGCTGIEHRLRYVGGNGKVLFREGRYAFHAGLKRKRF
jgi:hypothetical protein